MIQIKTFWDAENEVNDFLAEIGAKFVGIQSALGNYSDGAAAQVITVIYRP